MISNSRVDLVEGEKYLICYPNSSNEEGIFIGITKDKALFSNCHGANSKKTKSGKEYQYTVPLDDIKKMTQKWMTVSTLLSKW